MPSCLLNRKSSECKLGAYTVDDRLSVLNRTITANFERRYVFKFAHFDTHAQFKIIKSSLNEMWLVD